MPLEGSKAVPKQTATLGKTLSARNYDPEKFARSVSAQSDGDKDLQEIKQRTQNLGDETAQILKKQVYQNYHQFIDTAKEISYLEGEMFQLNHILTEQKNLMEQMMSMFATKTSEEVVRPEPETKVEIKEQEQRKVMSALVGKIEGCQSVIETPGRSLVHDGDMVELDLDSFSQIEKVHLFLFNDCAMLTTCSGSRRGNPAMGKYKFQVLWEMDTLAAVNARDVGPVKNAFKILAFPESRMFQCENSKEKREWLEIIDEAKRKHLSKKGQSNEVSSPVRTPTSPILNAFDYSSKRVLRSAAKKESHDERLRVDWLQEMPEDLDIDIAQRYFEQAVDLIQKTKNYLSGINDSPTKLDVETKLNNRTQQLIEVLSRELKSTPDHSLRGGPRLITKPVVLLIKLNETAKACNLFLINRSSAVAFAVRHLRTEGSLSLYIGKLCKVFFSHLEETGTEFNEAFQNIPGCYSSFVVWAQNEIGTFVDIFSQQVFRKSADITEVAECVQNAQAYCVRLHNLGLDLDFHLNHLLSSSILSTLVDHKQKIKDATKLRISEETWNPTNMDTPHALEKLVEEMIDLGLKNFAEFCFDECFVKLTGSTIAFTRAVISHVNSSLKMMLPELQRSILSGIVEILSVYTEFTSGCLRSEINRPDKARLILENGSFLAKSLLPLLESKVQKKIRQPPRALIDLREKFIDDIKNIQVPK